MIKTNTKYFHTIIDVTEEAKTKVKLTEIAKRSISCSDT